MHSSLNKAISLCSRDSDTDWHEKKTFKFIIPFYLKDGWGNRVCPEAPGDTATLWSIRVCDGFCIDQENVGWWSGLEGGWVGGSEWVSEWGGVGAVGAEGVAASLLMAGTSHRRGKGTQLIINIPVRVIIALSLVSYILPVSGLAHSPLHRVIGEMLWEAAAISLKGGGGVESQIHGGVDKRVKEQFSSVSWHWAF